VRRPSRARSSRGPRLWLASGSVVSRVVVARSPCEISIRQTIRKFDCRRAASMQNDLANGGLCGVPVDLEIEQRGQYASLT